mgnify:CR=1 FL=1
MLGSSTWEIGGKFQESGSNFAPQKSTMDWAEEILKTNKNLISNVELTPDELKDQAAAFDKFWMSYRKN